MKIAFCCVADEKTKYLVEAVRWAQAIRWFGGTVAGARLFVGLTDPCPAAYLSEFNRLEVSLVAVPRASDWHGPSNKIGVLSAPELAGFDCVVLSDCDVAFVADISEWLDESGVAAKPADFATLNNAALEGLFQTAGQPIPERRLTTTLDRVPLIPYCNTGVVVFGGALLPEFTRRWLHWNAFVLEHHHVLGSRTYFCDQASFALVLAEFLPVYRELPVGMNFPCHITAARIPADLYSIVPNALHYHDKVNGRTGQLLETTLPGPDSAIRRFNECVSRERRRHFANAVFWDERYLRAPELGSGIGSRGEFADLKAKIVQQFVLDHPGLRAIDFGCGDCSILERVDIPNYVGVDASAEVIRKNRLRFPGKDFVCGLLPDVNVHGDTSFCFDVLIHQPDQRSFDAVLDHVLALSAHGGLINGFDADPGFASDIVFFHTPLADALERRGVSFSRVGEYRNTTVYRWARPPNRTA